MEIVIVQGHGQSRGFDFPVNIRVVCLPVAVSSLAPKYTSQFVSHTVDRNLRWPEQAVRMFGLKG
jgi:hypothetical protein